MIQGTIKARIEGKLRAAFSPILLEVVDESYLHKGHNGHTGEGESHFSITIVSSVFCDLNRIQRQQRVYECLAYELRTCVHALRLKTLSPEEV